MSAQKRVVIVGGGFGGLNAAHSLRRAPVRLTLIDRRNFHLFQPLLYQVATGGLSPANIAAPLRAILKNQQNTKVRLGEVMCIDAAGHRVLLEGGSVPYDFLIVATGATHHYFGQDSWAESAPGLKTIEDATEIRRRILLAFERAEYEKDPVRREAMMTFVVVGGGPTGVEMAGALGEISHFTLRRDFRRIDPADARIVLLEGGKRLLATYPEALSIKARNSLRRLFVDVECGAMVTDISGGRVKYRQGDHEKSITAETIVWGAGVKASPMGRAVAEVTGAALDQSGRVIVKEDLSVPGFPDIFVIGDLAHFAHQVDEPLPGVAPVAIQQGRYLARHIINRLEGRNSDPFRYHDRGNMATIGRAAAVAELGRLQISGYPAWLAWLFVHLLFLVEFQNRVLVLMQWAWNYFTRNRSARLITGESSKDPNERMAEEVT